MTGHFTQDELLAIIEQSKQDVTNPPVQYKVPDLRSQDFTKMIDHTYLKLDAETEQIDQLCDEARRHDFKSVCVRLEWVERATLNVRDSSVVVACVIGFPEGTHSISEKVTEAKNAISAGASELDLVMNYHSLKQGHYSDVYTEIAAVRHIAPSPIVLKVILEISQLSTSDIVAGCKVAEAANVDFVKTSTGFCGEGATAAIVSLMKSSVRQGMKIKASGGIRTLQDCVTILEAGAERIGTSNGVKIMEEVGLLTRQGLLGSTATENEIDTESRRPN